MFSQFDQLYSQAREEDWRMQDGKPVTIGWLWGYLQGELLGSDAKWRCPFQESTLAHHDWKWGYQSVTMDLN
jgi:hypothetical protein